MARSITGSQIPPPLPLASKLLPLSALSSQPSDTKVRFLGCIRHYTPATATLTLTYPPRIGPRAEVNIAVPLPQLDMGSLRDGEWVNVIGCIAESSDKQVVKVDAVMLWSAGGMRIAEYARALEERLRIEEELDAALKNVED